MDEPDRPNVDGQTAGDHPPVEPSPTTVALYTDLPPPPFAERIGPDGRLGFRALSPRVAILIAAVVVVGVLLWMGRDSVRPFVLGLLLVYLLDPPVRWLVKVGVRRTLAILIVYVAALIAFIEFLNLTLTPLINEVVRFVDDFPALFDQFQGQLERLSEIYARLQLPEVIREWIDGLIAGIGQGSGSPDVDPTILLPVLTGASSLIGALFGYVVLPVFVFYLLKDRVTLTANFDRSLPETWRFDVWAVLRIGQRVLGQWVRGQLILGFVVGIATFVGLMILSVTIDPVFGRYAVLLSVIAGVLELVPIIGPIIAAIPAILLAATVGIEAVVAAFVLYLLVQQVENNFLVPRIQGNAVELHPAVVIFAIIIGGALAGLIGAILALPLVAAGRDITRYLFRRLSPESPEVLAASLEGLGLEHHPGIPGHPRAQRATVEPASGDGSPITGSS